MNIKNTFEVLFIRFCQLNNENTNENRQNHVTGE